VAHRPPSLPSSPPPSPFPQSTLFNAITESGKAQAANFPFCTIEPNVGTVAVPDPRLAVLSSLSGSKAIIPTSVEFVDIAGLVKGASKGEGLGNQFLANIRECDAVVQVVRCFEDDDVIHVAGKVDPAEDAGVINFELALADYAQVEKRLDKLSKGARAKTKEELAAQEIEKGALVRIMAALEVGTPARAVALAEDEVAAVQGLQLLTSKPMIYAANVAETDLADGGASNKHVATVRAVAEAAGSTLVVVSAQGLVTVTGGKWTTYRAMAEDVLAACFSGKLLPARPAGVTRTLRLVGAPPAGSATPPLTAAPGLHLYGSEAAAVQSLPGADRELLPGLTEAMVRFAVRAECARTVEDVLARRSRWLFLDAARAAAAAGPVAAIMAEELGPSFAASASAAAFASLARGYRLEQ
jgi:hypothetical protein